MEENQKFQQNAINFCNEFTKYYEGKELKGFQLEHKTVNNIKEIWIIVNRVEEDITNINTYFNMVEDKTRQNPNIERVEEAAGVFYNYSALLLDLKSFFIFGRLLMDDFSKMIKLIKGPDNLPDSIKDLLKNIEKYKPIDKDFFNKLEKELHWFMSFKSDRDTIIHKLEEIHIDKILKPEFKSKENKEYINLIPFMKEKLNQISDFVSFLQKNLLL